VHLVEARLGAVGTRGANPVRDAREEAEEPGWNPPRARQAAPARTVDAESTVGASASNTRNRSMSPSLTIPAAARSSTLRLLRNRPRLTRT